ncbi:MAG: AsnC family transcriptional regulator [Candidatus Odinarchaeota archaeon]
MDEIDLKIILLLMNNSRLTYREILELSKNLLQD